MDKLHKARKRFGQNFLQDQGVIARIVAVINPQLGDKMVEIGPGKGALTVPLLAQIGHLDVIELDRDLIPILKTTCLDKGNICIHQTDALRYDFAQLTTNAHSLRVVGNLPYNISTPLLFHLLNYATLIKDMHFMLQKEVVDRMVAQPHTADYGRLSIMIQYFCKADALFLVRPDSFKPAPKVDSAIIRLVPHKVLPYPVHDLGLFQRLVTQAFSQRRKTLRNTLKGWVSEAELRSLAIDPQSRPENLGLQDYVSICRYLEQTSTTVP